MLEGGVWKGPIIDQHMHLDRENRFLEAISDFVQSGGTGIMLVHKPGFSGTLPTDIDGYRTAYSETLGMADEVRTTHGIDVGVVLGPHPVAWEHQIEPLGLERSTELHIEAVGLALDHIEADEANCLGEVGRPHYPVDEMTWTAANDLLLEVMSMASGAGVTIQLHVEDNGEKTCRGLSELCGKAGLPLDQAVRHYAPADVSAGFTHGLSATVSVGKGSVEALTGSARSACSPWGMETDYLDDPRRPGAVLGPKTVPRRTRELCDSLLSDEWDEDEVTNLMTNIHVDWPKALYGL